MATKLANPGGPNPQTPHTSGLYADMTLDGPEIGTLVIVFDRAKNLPNRKTMGKQNPYCAARLAKEAKKTETDRRGGQTPRWDQELRFIVHDSPDYQKIKISIFSEDKRTDLIGEAWVDLTPVIVPGGGKSDLWQSLTFKGKYAGELRIELTYYDERPKHVEPAEDLTQSFGSASSRVKRRPLPFNPSSRHVTPDTIPGPAPPTRAKHGPRDPKALQRPNSMPPELSYPHPPPAQAAPVLAHGHSHGNLQANQAYQAPFHQYHSAHDLYEEPQSYGEGRPSQQDFLPQLPPTNRSRNSLPMTPRMDARPEQTPLPSRPFDHHMGMQHSHSSPIIPTTQRDIQQWDGVHQLRTDFPEPIPDVEYQYQRLEARPRTSDPAQEWQVAHHHSHVDQRALLHQDDPAPPPPPVHSNSSPAVPQRATGYRGSSPAPLLGATPPHLRHNSTPNTSPLQSFGRNHSTPPRQLGQGSPLPGAPMDPYTPSPQQRSYPNSPAANITGQTPSPFARQPQPPRTTPNRPNVVDPYYSTTPTRPHPLSQEVPQTHSPPTPFGSSPYAGTQPTFQTQYRSREGLPLIKPRPVSPQASPQPPSQPNSAPRSKSSYDIQFPVRSFESADNSPLSTSQPNLRAPQMPKLSTPIRKSVSPHTTPTPPHSAGATPYSPDSFNIHNPNAQASTLSNGNSPHSPYQIRPGAEMTPREEITGPIVDSHGNEVDPSDRLPIHSWAPEPEKKTPVRTYGLGRDRDFGPRSPQSAEALAGKSMMKDTIINVRSRAQTQSAEPTPLRSRLQKKSTPPGNNRSAIPQPLQERPNYNSSPMVNTYEQQEESNGGIYDHPYEQHGYSGSYAAMSDDALSREISSIDIGGGRYPRGTGVPAPTAYVPVRSHRDRKTMY